jgi:DNA polymerase-1
MNTLVLDIETDSLDPTLVHVCVIKNINTGNILSFTKERKEFLNKQICNADRIVGHNALSFDIPVLNKLWDMKIDTEKVYDTLVLSYLLKPNIEDGHSLDAWGKRLDMEKIEFSDFKNLSTDMIRYCIQDVKVTEKLYQLFLTEIKRYDFSEQSIKLEHDIRNIINKQQAHGFYLDIQKAHTLMSNVKNLAHQIKRELLEEVPVKIKFIKNIIPKINKDGSMSSVGLKQIPNYSSVVSGEFSLIDYENFNLGSPKQIIERLNTYGWKPKDFTVKGSPRITEKNLMTVSKSAPKAVQRLAEWKMLRTRAKTIESWLDAVDSKNRVHGKVITMGAVTSRMTHTDPNMANIVSGDKPYGLECRSCWTVPTDKKVLVGMDAKGLELRMLAHYLNDEVFTEEVINGDPHTLNQKAAGLPTRSAAKTFIYAFLYGAGSAKIGSIINGSSTEGEKLKNKFISNMPKLKTLLQNVSKSSKKGYLKGLDGRQIFIRHNHAALNTLLQGAGAIVCKKWSVFLDKEIKRRKLNAFLVNTIHDELQFECTTEHADNLCSLADSTIQKVGEYFNMNVPLNADAKIGKTWAETH